MANVEKDPHVDCYDPLQVPPPGEQGKDRSILISGGEQPFPFYGTIEVGWSSGP